MPHEDPYPVLKTERLTKHDDSHPTLTDRHLSSGKPRLRTLVLRGGLAAVAGLLALVTSTSWTPASASSVPRTRLRQPFGHAEQHPISAGADRSPSGRHDVPVPERRLSPRPVGP
jgi:hypothetical protein